jgi:hypothetical protein
MANEERRDLQIRERAGLEESLINQDFKDFLQRWGGPVLTCVAVLALGYFGYTKWQQRKQAATGSAFTALNQQLESENPSPDNLLAVALDHASTPGVAAAARLAAADAYLNIVRRGIMPGASLNPDGTLADPADALSADDREKNLSLAAENYKWVLENAANDPAKALDSIGALYGLAAVAESRGAMDEAKGYYERIIALSKPWGEGGHAKVAQQRIDSLPALAAMTAVPEKAMVPAPLNTAPAVPAAPVADLPAAGLNLGGAAVESAPVTPVPVAPNVAPAAEPQPAPAPAPDAAPAPEAPKKP